MDKFLQKFRVSVIEKRRAVLFMLLSVPICMVTMNDSRLLDREEGEAE